MAENKDKDEQVTEASVSDEKEEKVNENGSTEDEKPAENGDNAKKDKVEEKPTKDEEKDDEDDGESSEEELGILEKPLIITTKRERKSVEVYGDKKEEEENQKDVLDYSKGRGIKLGDIPIIKSHIEKADSEDLHVLHRIMYRTNGKKHMVKRNIKEFCGWPFDEESKEFKNVKMNTIERFIIPALKWTINLLGLEKSNDKEAMQDALCEFLLKPVMIEKKVPEKRKSGGGSKRKSSGKKNTPKSKSKSKAKKKSKGSDDDEDDDEVSDVSDASDSSESEGEEEKEEKPAKKKTPQAKKSPKKKKATPVKVAIPAKKSKSASKKRKPDASDESSEDEEPSTKKSKVPPTNSELKKVVSAILADADLEQITMKSVVRQVYEKYSTFDLSSRKDFIKATVKDLIT